MSSKNRRRESGFTLVEMIVVTMLLAIAMVGLLAVFDASARINKNETDVADAQGAVRYGLYQMTRAIRMAGAGGLYVTQAVLNHNDRGLTGIAPAGASFDNTTGVTVTDTAAAKTYAVREGTDIIEIRGVILSPLIGFDQQTEMRREIVHESCHGLCPVHTTPKSQPFRFLPPCPTAAESRRSNGRRPPAATNL